MIGNSHLTYVVQEGTTSDDANMFRRQAHSTCDGNGERSHSFRVSLSLSILQVEGIAQGFKRNVVRALQVGHGAPQVISSLGHQRFQIGLIRAILHFQAPVF